MEGQEFFVVLNDGYEISYIPANMGITEVEFATLTLDKAEKIHFAGFVTSGPYVLYNILN